MKYVLLIFLLSQAVFAKPVGPVVKVRSFVCQRPQQYRMGSGTIFKIHDKTFVLTSDHVVFAGTRREDICHVVSNEVAEDIDVELYSLNFARGLALLSLEHPETLAAQVVDFDTLRADDSIDDKLILSGAPFKKEPGTYFRHVTTEVQTTRSNRLLFPLVPRSIEVRGFIKYGMSGGPAWTLAGDFSGVTTNRYEDENLKLADLKEFDPQEPLPPVIIGLVIPNSVIIPWIEQVFGKHPERAALYPDLDAELEGKFKINLDGILFAANVCGDGAGVGGGDPGQQEAVSSKPIEIPMTLQIPENPSAWPFPHSAAWMQKFKVALSQRKSIVITGFERDGVPYPVTDLMQAFTYLERGYEPNVRIIGAPDQNLDQVHKQILEKAAVISLEVAKLRTQVNKGRHEAYLLDAIEMQMDRIKNQQLERVKDAMLQDLVDPSKPGSPNAKGWDALHHGLDINHPNVEVINSAANLRAWLRALKADLGKVRLQ